MREQWVLFESASLGDARLEVRSLEGHDELNQLFRFVAHVVRPGVQMSHEDVVALLDSPVTLKFEEDGRVLQRIHGIAAEVSTRTDVESDLTELRIEIVPRAFWLTQRRGSEIFVNRSVPEVLAEKLSAVGLAAGVDFLMPLRESYPVREFIAQYEETDHAFVARLCERHGIVTFFEHQSGRDVLVLTDTPATFQPIERPRVPVRHRRAHPAAWDVQTTLRRVPAQAETLDYNYRTPLLSLRDRRPTSKPAALGGWVEYGPHSKTVEETGSLSRIRTEELGARHHTVTARTTEASVRAGGTFHLDDSSGHDQHLLVTRVSHHFRASDGDGGQRWENEISCIPAAVAHRPPRVTPWPKISGLLNAVVDGAIKGHYAELDESGRYHLRMLYDRSGRTNLGATHPVRMMQPHAGANYGMHFPLRPGAEVLVGFVNGDPDRPVIVGSAPNPVTSSPVVQQNQTQNVLRTGSNNEMVIEDEHGHERIRIHTPHMRTTVQLGSVEEAEEGALTTTEAHISEASRLSNNEVTTRKTLLADSAASLLGRSVVLAAGASSLTAAAGRGIEQPGAVSPDGLFKDLSRLSLPPESRAAAGTEERAEARAAEGAPGGGALWSTIAATVTEATQSAVNDLVRAVATTTDNGLDQAIGRLQGEPLGQPMDPSAVMASERTAALVGREVGVVFGDRVAAVSSFHTASVMGNEMAFLKSPGAVELAAGREAKVTTAGPLDMEARLVRVVGGYYPEAEAPPLDEGTSVGVMSRRDLRLLSVEDCILVCAKKNLIGAAHTGDMKLSAKDTMALTAGGLTASAGSVTLSSGDTISVDADGDITVTSGGNVTVEAAGDVVVKGATVTVEAGSIKLSGTVLVEGDLTVTGSLNGG